MMNQKCLIGIGSNLGDRRANMERGLKALGLLDECRRLKTAPVFQTPALIPEGAPETWRLPYLNSVAEVEWTSGPDQLLETLKAIESEIGREKGPRWSPRALDLDLLTFGAECLEGARLTVPHPELWRRAFVLAPLKHLDPEFVPPLRSRSVLLRARELEEQLPLWMGILNVTPDSFSEDGLGEQTDFMDTVARLDSIGVQAIDFGAESTRPSATPVSPQEEMRRLRPALERAADRFGGRLLKPWISVDTRHAQTAAWALELGADMINDVSGLSDPAMIEVLKSSSCQILLMHSLSVPADPGTVWPETQDPIEELLRWAADTLELLSRHGIEHRRVILDPGLGFGKTAAQSLTILREIEKFLDLPVRVTVGHSRKSFMNLWHAPKAKDRDFESVGVSLSLARRGVDILRVHNVDAHMRSHHAHQELES